MEKEVEEPTADIQLSGNHSGWLSGEHLREQLRERSADPGLSAELDQLAGDVLQNV
jgi:hypothetical protein